MASEKYFDWIWINREVPELGGFHLGELDRHIGKYSQDFLEDSQNRKMISACCDWYREHHSISILDCGCGTGRALWTLKDQLIFRCPDEDHEKLRATGINLHDFSALSTERSTREAVANGLVEYIVGNCAEIAPDLGSTDFILMYEMLIWNDVKDVAKILKNYAKGLSVGGRLYASMNVDQFESKTVSNALDRIALQGYSILSEIKEESGYFRAFLLIERQQIRA